MLRFEEYIARRKKEDRLNEFDVDTRAENTKICVNYVFEYFNNYLSITAAEDKTTLQNEKIEKYRKQLDYYLSINNITVMIHSTPNQSKASFLPNNLQCSIIHGRGK